MQELRNIYLNARFLTMPVTGVQRYAREICAFLPELKRVAPTRPMRGFAGHLWEQSALLKKTSNSPLWSPCNTGPIFHPRHAVTIQDISAFDFPQAFTPAFRTWYQWLLPKLAKNARLVIISSAFTGERLQAKFGISDKKLLLAPGAASADFQPASTDAINSVKRRLKIETEYVFCVGSTDPRKNTELVYRVAKLLKNEKNLEFLLAGGSSEKVFAKLSDRERPANVRHLGFVDDATLKTLMSGAAAFIFPSFYEGFGLPVLEAMGCGTPVIAADIQVLREVGGDAAIYCDPSNPLQWESAIRDLLRYPASRLELARRGAARNACFSWRSAALDIARGLGNL